jgi:hypothetical protein
MTAAPIPEVKDNPAKLMTENKNEGQYAHFSNKLTINDFDLLKVYKFLFGI